MNIVYLHDHPHHRATVAQWLMNEWGARYPERTLNDWISGHTYMEKGKVPCTLIALDNEMNQPIGTVCLREDGMTTYTDWKGWLSYLLVPEQHRGQGIAKELLNAAENIASSIGIETLHLFTRLDDPKLYANVGWESVGREEYRGGMVTVMKKNFPLSIQLNGSNLRCTKSEKEMKMTPH